MIGALAFTRKEKRAHPGSSLLLLVRSEHPHPLGGDDLGIVRQELAEVGARLARERVALALAGR
jgi:hypothetical protein